jgi:hypothetical protein
VSSRSTSCDVRASRFNADSDSPFSFSNINGAHCPKGIVWRLLISIMLTSGVPGPAGGLTKPTTEGSVRLLIEAI